MQQSRSHTKPVDRRSIFRTPIVFGLFWAALFLLYLPASQSGWVSDTLGWLDAVRTQSFADFIARKGFSVPSYYQLTQVVTWCYYQLFGANQWAWHLLQLSLHALNATLLFALMRGIFRDSSLADAEPTSLVIAALFCFSPYVSEVIVWEAAYHFLQGLLFLLIQLHLLRRIMHGGRLTNALLSVALYTASLFSLELFYLVPLLSAALCLYYYLALGWDKARVKRAALAIVLPQALLLLTYFVVLRLLAGATTGRLGNDWLKLPATYYLVKPPEYVFHLLGGRFLPQSWRQTVYHVCSSYIGAAAFYLALLVLIGYIVLRFKRMRREGQLISFLFIWLLLTIALVSALWFPERLLIVGDRYLYALLPPFLGLLVLSAHQLIKSPLIRRVAFALLLLPGALLTLNLNRTWQDSTVLTEHLQQGLTDAPDKITILLNNPASLRGAAMIGAGMDGEARLMHNLFYTPPIRGQMFDAPAVHLLEPTDSVHIQFLDVQTLKVSLTRPGTFWQFGPDVARSVSMEPFTITVDDPNCCYTLSLTYHPSQYRLLYQYRGQWRQLSFPKS